MSANERPTVDDLVRFARYMLGRGSMGVVWTPAHQDAEDAVSDAVLGALKALSKWDGSTKWSTYAEAGMRWEVLKGHRQRFGISTSREVHGEWTRPQSLDASVGEREATTLYDVLAETVPPSDDDGGWRPEYQAVLDSLTDRDRDLLDGHREAVAARRGVTGNAVLKARSRLTRRLIAEREAS